MLVRIFLPFRRSISFLKHNFNRTISVGTSFKHENSRLMTPSSSLQGNNPSNKAPILFRTRTPNSAPRLIGIASSFSRNYAFQPGAEEKQVNERTLSEIRKVLEFAKDYKQKASVSNNLSRRKLLELYGFALNLARKFASIQAKSLELEMVEIIKVFLWEELRIKQDVAVANLAQSMNLFKAKLKNIRLNFQSKRISSETVSESLQENSRATEELVQWMFQQVKELLAPSPCRFTTVSLGSLARGMASPYSDTEYFILVESSVQKNRTHFENFADIFDFLMIGFGESPIYEASDLLNSEPTLAETYKRFKKGMRVDQHKKPQDFNRLLPLITTGRELVERLPHDIIHKTGNHLTAALFSTQYLWGDKVLYEEYRKLFAVALGTREYLNCIQKLLRQDIDAAKIQKLLLENRLLEKSQEPFELKPLLTITIQLAEGLAILLKIKGEKLVLQAHPFELLNQLREGNYISETQHEIWQNVMRILFEMRFQLQQENQSAEASISPQNLEKAIPILKVCTAIQTMIEIVESHLSKCSQFKTLPLLQDILQSEAKVLGAIPRQDNIFVERKVLLEELQRNLRPFDAQKDSKIRTVVCFGLGGMGKTQLALHYLRYTKEPYTFRAWLPANSRVELERCYRILANQCGFFDEKATIQEVIQYMKDYLSEHPGWLLVYDNANTYEEIAPFLPENGGAIIITTRHKRWPDSYQKMPISVMRLEEALKMIQVLSDCKVEQELKEAKELAQVLGYLPLALAQAGAYIKETRKSIGSYLVLYKKYAAELLAEDTLPQVDKEVQSLPVGVTWNITLQAILEKEKESATPLLVLELLTVCAYLAPNRIPREYILTWLKIAYPKLEHPELRLNHCLIVLVQYSMIDYEEEYYVTVHPLVQTVLLGQQQQPTAKQKMFYPKLTLKWHENLFLAGMVENIRKPEALEISEINRVQLLPHLLTLIRHYDKLWNKEQPSFNVVCVLTIIAKAFNNLGDPWSAKSYYERALKIQEAHYQEKLLSQEEILTNLGLANHAIGSTQQAKELFTKLLSIKESRYGKDHWKLAETLSNLGRVHLDLGEISQAKDMLTKALKIFEERYGKDDWRVARVLNILGVAFNYLGEAQPAKEFLSRALKIQETLYGKDDWEVVQTLGNLGNALRILKEKQQAKEVLTRALKIQERYLYLGTAASDVVDVLMLLGRTLGDLEETQAAKTMLIKALKIQETIYGKEHVKVAEILVQLGITLGAVESQQAKEFLSRALKIQEAHYEKKHPQVLENLISLGVVLSALGELKEAKELYVRALEILESYHGKEHRQIVLVLNELGNIYHHLKDFKKAKELYVCALEIQEKHYPTENWRIGKILHDLGGALHALREFKQAKEFLTRALKIFETYYGEKHSEELVMTLMNLGKVLRDLGELKEAKELFARALKMGEVHYGKDHWEIFRVLTHLSHVLHALGEVKQAEELQMRSFSLFVKHYLENHPIKNQQNKPISSAPALVPQFDASKQVKPEHTRKILAIYQAAESGNEEVVRQLLEHPHRLDINQAEAESGRTALHVAVLNRRKNVVALLLQAGAKEDIADKQGKTALSYALESGDQEIHALLKSKKPSNGSQK